MVKAVFFDIDGTLVSFRTHRMPDSTVAALHRLRQRGVRTFIATGRQYPAINNLGGMPFDGYITMNGSFCFVGDYEVVRKQAVPPADIEALLGYMRQHGEFPCFFISEKEAFGNFIDDNVRRVFDSILSVENIVENEAGVLKAIQEAGEILTGLSAEDRSSIGAIALEARERAKERILAEREKRMKELRSSWTADANAELLSIPLYRAWTAIRKAGGLDGAEVKSLCGEGVAAELKERGLLARKPGGAPAADYAAKENFASAEEMLRSLAESPNPREYVEKYLRDREKDFDDAEQMEMIGVSTEANIALIDRIVEELSIRLNREESRLSRAKLKAAANAELAEWKLKDLLLPLEMLCNIFLSQKLSHAF